MPNWCGNQLILRHSDKSKFEALVEELSKGEDRVELFKHFRPRPLTEEENWYDWNVANWGTKWEANVHYSNVQDDEITIDFDTAWSPPVDLYEHITKDGWEIEAAYSEPGMGFVGQFRASGTVVWDNDSYEWDYEGEEPFKHIPQELVEWAGLEDSRREYLEENQ